jgi:hypothetical protein
MSVETFFPVRATPTPMTGARALDIFLCELPVPQIMALYSVSKSVVYDIKAGRTWSHVTGRDNRRDPGTRQHYDDPRTGVVALYSKWGGKIVERRYRGAEGRKKTLDALKETFGEKRFSQLQIAITPDIDADALNHSESDPLNEKWWGVSRRGKKGGEKRKLQPEGADRASKSHQTNRTAPNFDDLRPAVGLDRLTQIDAQIQGNQKVA